MNALVAVDLRTDASETVAKALPWIVRFDLAADLVFVDVELGARANAPRTPFVAPVDRVVQRETRTLERLLATLPLANRGEAIVDITSVHDMCSQRAAAYSVVIAGTSGRTGLAHLWAGSVAERIVRFAPGSVLVVRALEPGDPLRILLAVDPSDADSRLPEALGPLAGRLGARVDVLAVDEVATGVAIYEAPHLARPLGDPAEQVAHRALTRVGASGGQAPHAIVGRAFVPLGSPAAEIVRRAPDYDLVVVGTHGRTGMQRALLGSVAERVVRRSPRSVLVLRP